MVPTDEVRMPTVHWPSTWTTSGTANVVYVTGFRQVGGLPWTATNS